MFNDTPLPHTEAAAAIRGKTIVTQRTFEGLLPELQEAAFVISGVECFDTLQRIRDAIAAIPEGGDWRKAKTQITAELGPWLEEEPAKRRAELLLRQHTFRAYAATAYRLHEAHKETFPFRQYIATNDTNVRPAHAALHGKILPASSPFWDSHTGPWDYGCRCEAVPLLPDEVAEYEAEDTAKQLPPEAHRLVPPAILDRTEKLGFIDVGPHESGGVPKSQGVYDIRTPREKTGDPNAFEWRPGEIGIPLAAIQKRYDPAVFLLWEAWARSTKLPDGKPVWDAMESTQTNGSPEPRPRANLVPYVPPAKNPKPSPKPKAAPKSQTAPPSPAEENLPELRISWDNAEIAKVQKQKEEDARARPLLERLKNPLPAPSPTPAKAPGEALPAPSAEIQARIKEEEEDPVARQIREKKTRKAEAKDYRNQYDRWLELKAKNPNLKEPPAPQWMTLVEMERIQNKLTDG